MPPSRKKKLKELLLPQTQNKKYTHKYTHMKSWNVGGVAQTKDNYGAQNDLFKAVMLKGVIKFLDTGYSFTLHQEIVQTILSL